MDQTLTITLFTGLMVTAAYVFGSISSAVLICRIVGLPDPRTKGSRNPGATNVLRIGGAAPAVATLAFDILKGTLPVYGSYFLGLPPFSLGLIAIAACLGHMYPVFFGFQGGKAVATALGSIGPIGWDMTGLLLGTWLVTAVIGRYSSLASLVTVVLAPLYAYWLKPEYTIAVVMLSILMVVRHRANISRLLNGTEPHILDKTQRKRKKAKTD
ncbi:glycerol-3-phosphate acyltransferase [Neiella marina]|uniref:Glycerol-3-phosphate acyltransferase n=1 Tax=Neiella marina TaxID=508461 RepID=A0A8J2U679_9GAMM|nr:glycerol-3-phosphate acyltransferase [Neiella marina]